MRSSLLLASLVLFTSSTALADQPTPARSIYRFDVSITGIDDSAHPAPATYTIVLEEGRAGALSTGANVPLAANARQDVGLSLHLSYTLTGSVVVLEGGVELSSVDGARGIAARIQFPRGARGIAARIQRVRAEGVVPIRPGTPALLASIYDPASGRRYDVTISAQRLL